MGAIASGGVRVLNPDLADQVEENPGMLAEATERELAELRRRERLYRGDRPPLNLSGKTVILVDDGLATGSSMRAAVQAVRQHRPERVVVAVPVASPETCRTLAREVDEIVCATTPERFSSVGRWYLDFDQTSDAEVERLLARAWRS
jgi:predicted phosphoribosyltransferase